MPSTDWVPSDHTSAQHLQACQMASFFVFRSVAIFFVAISQFVFAEVVHYPQELVLDIIIYNGVFLVISSNSMKKESKDPS